MMRNDKLCDCCRPKVLRVLQDADLKGTWLQEFIVAERLGLFESENTDSGNYAKGDLK